MAQIERLAFRLHAVYSRPPGYYNTLSGLNYIIVSVGIAVDMGVS